MRTGAAAKMWGVERWERVIGAEERMLIEGAEERMLIEGCMRESQ